MKKALYCFIVFFIMISVVTIIEQQRVKNNLKKYGEKAVATVIHKKGQTLYYDVLYCDSSFVNSVVVNKRLWREIPEGYRFPAVVDKSRMNNKLSLFSYVDIILDPYALEQNCIAERERISRTYPKFKLSPYYSIIPPRDISYGDYISVDEDGLDPPSFTKWVYYSMINSLWRIK